MSSFTNVLASAYVVVECQATVRFNGRPGHEVSKHAVTTCREPVIATVPDDWAIELSYCVDHYDQYRMALSRFTTSQVPVNDPAPNLIPANFVHECEHVNTAFEDIVYGDTVYGWDLICLDCETTVKGDHPDWAGLDAYIERRRADEAKYI